MISDTQKKTPKYVHIRIIFNQSLPAAVLLNWKKLQITPAQRKFCDGNKQLHWLLEEEHNCLKMTSI